MFTLEERTHSHGWAEVTGSVFDPLRYLRASNHKEVSTGPCHVRSPHLEGIYASPNI